MSSKHYPSACCTRFPQDLSDAIFNGMYYMGRLQLCPGVNWLTSSCYASASEASLSLSSSSSILAFLWGCCAASGGGRLPAASPDCSASLHTDGLQRVHPGSQGSGHLPRMQQ